MAEIFLTKDFGSMTPEEQDTLITGLHVIANDLEKGTTQKDAIRFVLEVPDG